MSTHLILRLGRGFGMGWHGMAFRWLAIMMFVVFLALLVVGVVLLLRRGTGTSTPPRPMDQALVTVRMRYAQGEMTTQEFLEANEALGGGPPPTAPPAPPTPPA